MVSRPPGRYVRTADLYGPMQLYSHPLVRTHNHMIPVEREQDNIQPSLEVCLDRYCDLIRPTRQRCEDHGEEVQDTGPSRMVIHDEE
jgi:hypothetical protein